MNVASISSVFANWPIDWILIGAFAAFAAFDALRNGPSRATALVLCLPAALFFMNTLSNALFLGSLAAQFTTPLSQAGVFAVVVVALYFVVHRAISTFSTGLPPLQALMTGLAAAIVLVVVWLLTPGLDAVWNFGDQARVVFGEAYRFWWLAASYVAIAAARS